MTYKSRYDLDRRKTLAVIVAVSMLMVCVPASSLDGITFDLWSSSENSVPPTDIENNDNASGKGETDNASVDASTTTEETVTPVVTPEIPVTTEEDLPAEETVTPTEEVSEEEEEVADPSDEESDGEDGEPTSDPTEPLEHIGGTEEVVKNPYIEETTDITEETPLIPVGFTGVANTVYLFNDGVLYDEWNIYDSLSKNKKSYKVTEVVTEDEYLEKIEYSQFELPNGKICWKPCSSNGTLITINVSEQIIYGGTEPIYLCAI